MSGVPLKDSQNNVFRPATFTRQDGAETVHMQAVVVVDPASGLPVEAESGGATEATLSGVLSVIEILSGKIDACDTQDVRLDAGTLAALETVTVANPGLTDEQLRAAALPLPDGAATEITQAFVRTAVEALVGALMSTGAASSLGDKGLPSLAKRRDADIALVEDGQYGSLNLDETGRLKVASHPASYADISGSITAIQATIGTPVAGGTVSGDVSRASNVMAFCTGTFAGVNVTFEGSLASSGDTNWFVVQAVRSNANTIETATGALSAQPIYSWELSVNALARLRVRCTARTSGTQNWLFKLGTYATEPIPAAQVSATQPVSGTVTANKATPTPNNLSSAATTNGTLVKSSAGTLYNVTATNNGASAAYIKLYNKATAPVVGTDAPVLTVQVAAGATLPLSFGSLGHRFATGIGLGITGGSGDSDTTAVALAQVKVLTSFV